MTPPHDPRSDNNAPLPRTAFAADQDAEDLDDVLLSYAEAQAAAPHNPALLREAMGQYPQYADDLRAVSCEIWTEGADWLVSDNTDRGGEEGEDADIIAIGRSVFASLYGSPAPAPPLTDLLAAAKAQGLSAKALADALHIDVPMLARLQQRLVRISSLPRTLVEQMARTLDRTADDIITYLRGGATLASGVHYKAAQAPTVGTPGDFHTLLASSNADIQGYWQNQTDLLGEE